MTASELKRWLKKQGCTFTQGTKHTIVHLDGEFTEIPRHPFSRDQDRDLQRHTEKARSQEEVKEPNANQRAF